LYESPSIGELVNALSNEKEPTRRETPFEGPTDKSVEPAPPTPITDTFLLQLRDIVKQEFAVTYAYIDARDNMPIFVITEDDQIKERSTRLTERLRPHNLLAVIRRVELFEGTGERSTVIKLVPGPPARKASNYAVNIVLFAVTVITVLWAGWYFAQRPDLVYVYTNFLHIPYDPLVVMVEYGVAILAIIGLHEFGHLVGSRLHRVEASLPYFIPGIPYGTFGALIVQRSPPSTRDSLFDLGLTGPLVGFVIAIIVVFFGVLLSPVLSPIQYNELYAYVKGIGGDLLPLPLPLLFEWIKDLMILGIPAGYTILIHPVAYAGYVGFFITGLNYFPIGQLDGGHVARALFGQKYHRIVSVAAVLILFFVNPLMALIAFFLFSGRHPGPVDDVSPLSRGRKIVGVLSWLIPVLVIPPSFLLL
jgi:hypothetical protein